MAKFIALAKKFPGNVSKVTLVNLDNVETISETGQNLATFVFKSGCSHTFAFSITDMEKLLNENANEGSTKPV